jgi:hypothetical protein
MAIPQSIIGQLQFLQNQYNQAQPLLAQPRSIIVALQLNAANLVAALDTAETNAVGQLDSWTQPGDPFALISSLQALLTAAQDQTALFNIRSLIGRVTSNLDQLV